MTEHKVTYIGVASLAGMTAVITWGMSILFGWPLIFFEEVIAGAGIVSYMIFILAGLVGGLVIGGVAAVIYNFAAMFMGGVVLDLETT